MPGLARSMKRMRAPCVMGQVAHGLIGILVFADQGLDIFGCDGPAAAEEREAGEGVGG